MAVAKADASSSVQPRSLDKIANQALAAEPVHDDITGSCLKCFEHRHLADDTVRQVGELRKLCRRRPDGFFLHELAPLAQLLTHVAARLERLGGESGDLGPAAAVMISLCTRPFQMKLASDEARFTADATPLFEALALFLSTPAPRHPGAGPPASRDPVFTAAADTLEAVSLRLAALRPDAAAAIRTPTPPSLAALDACHAAEGAMRAMFQASSSARQQRLCDLLLAMCRGSVGACKQLLEQGAFPPVLEQLRALVAGETAPGGGTAGGAEEVTRAQRRSAAEVSDSSDLDSSDEEDAAAAPAAAGARPGSGSSRRSSRPGSGRSRRSNAAAAAAAAAAALEADIGSGTDEEIIDEPPDGLSPSTARPFSAQVSGLGQTKGWGTGGSARAGTAPPARSPAASAARLAKYAPPPPPPAAAAASKPAGGATSGDTAGFFESADTARMASRLLELLQCVAGQCPDFVGPLLASKATCAALLPLLQALMGLPMPSLAQRLLRNDALSLLLRAAMSHGGPNALQQAGVTKLLAAAAAASLPSDPPPPPQPVKGSDVTGAWKVGDGYNVALAASRVAKAHAAADVQMQLYETLGGAATADPRDDDESLLRLTAGRTLEDFETRETIFSLLLQCSALIAREAREARLASSLLDYFGEGGDTDGALGNSEAAPGDPRAGWTGDQVATLQLLSLSLLQVLAPHDPIPFLEPFPPSLRFPEGGGDAGGAAIWMLVEQETGRLDSGGLECDDPIERQLSANLLSKGLKLLAEPLIAAQLLELDALPAIVELCFRPLAAPNVPVEEGMIPCEALMLLAAAVEAREAAACALVSLGLVPRLLTMLTMPIATAGRALPMDAKSSITAQLLMHRMDVLLSLSTSNADPAFSCLQWDAVSAALWQAGALQTLMRLLPSLPPPLLPIGFALLAEWCRDERQMRELLTWKAPPGVLGPPERAPDPKLFKPGAPLPPSSIGTGTMYMQPVVPGEPPKNLRPDSLLLLLRLWADNEKQQPNRHLVAAKPSADGIFAPPKRPAASSLSDPPNQETYEKEKLPPWRARAEEAKGGACVKPVVANGVAHGADLQLKLFGVLARARARGLPLPVLPPYEASLLVAVEAASGQRTATAWRQVAAGLQAEGLRPVAADLARLETQAAAGQRQVEANPNPDIEPSPEPHLTSPLPLTLTSHPPPRPGRGGMGAAGAAGAGRRRGGRRQGDDAPQAGRGAAQQRRPRRHDGAARQAIYRAAAAGARAQGGDGGEIEPRRPHAHRARGHRRGEPHRRLRRVPRARARWLHHGAQGPAAAAGAGGGAPGGAAGGGGGPGRGQAAGVPIVIVPSS